MNRSWRLRRAACIAGLAVLAALCFNEPLARAETVYLSTGEVIQGKIIRVDDNTVSVESDRGYGVIQLNKSDIILIEYENKNRDPSRTVGMGYFYRSAPVVPSATTDYGLNALSFKYWMSAKDSIGALFGYYNASTSSSTQLQVFSFDLRYANVLQRRGMLDVYWGGSIGVLSVNDQVSGNNINTSGTRAGLFVGTEIFFVSLPNLGVSTEVGFYTQTIGSRVVTDLSAGSYPTIAVHYYF